MFGLVNPSLSELTDGEKMRYNGVYCGICRAIRAGEGQLCRFALSYDMAFLALLHMSLYEPEERSGARACVLHPVKPKPWVGNPAVEYAADMNVALAYYKFLDDWNDDHSPAARVAADFFGRHIPALRESYPRQCEAMESCLAQLSRLERENCRNPDEPANCFGRLMGELMVWKEDLWAENLRQLGHHLGRFIYLADAAIDYRADRKKQKYNPLAAMGPEDPKKWEEYLVLAMGACTDAYERLPLVQDKGLLDNILYSGVWVGFRRAWKESRKEKENG